MEDLLRHTFEFSNAETLSAAAPLLCGRAWTIAKCVLPVMATAWTCRCSEVWHRAASCLRQKL